MTTYEALSARGIINAVSDPALADLFEKEIVSFYCGYDPSFHSLQLGNLFAIVTMRRMQLLGHRPVVLVGGATGSIGDPSGRSTERNLLDMNTVQNNVRCIRAQLEKYLEFGSGPRDAILVNNYDWTGNVSFLNFLRDVGRRFRVSEMLARESVKRRMDSEDGISFTEFAYQCLQANDFLHLYQAHNVRLQIGGGDQWGNITAGIDLVRKVEQAQVFGMVIPLVTDSQGRKFGKSTGGAIYLDPTISSPYQMYQFLLNAEDACVGGYLRYYTFLPDEEIAALEEQMRTAPEQRAAQKRLAAEVVQFVHGADGLRQAQKATDVFFGAAIEDMSEQDLEAIFAGVPRVDLPRDGLSAGLNVVDVLAQTPLFKGKNDVRRSIEQHGAYVNNRPVESAAQTVTEAQLVGSGAIVVRKGKKNYALVKFV